MKEDTTTVTRTSERELVVSHTLNAPPHLVWEAWTKPDLFRQWWVPHSFGLSLVSCELDVRPGGEYRLAFLHEGATLEFYGTYLEVDSPSRLVWTNEEDGGQTVTTVTFEEDARKTRLTVSNRYPTKEALESDGSTAALPEVLGQLEELLDNMGSGAIAEGS